MVKLIGTYVSPYARRVAAALIACRIPYEHEDLNGYAQPSRAREVNPVGKVPVLVLDDGERLIDSSAILDYLNELTEPAHELVPRSGRARRMTLRLAAIATTVCEQITTRYFEQQRSGRCGSDELLERYRLQIVGGFKALDEAAGSPSVIGNRPLDAATISAVIAFEYGLRWSPDLDLAKVAPALAAEVATLGEEPVFARTRPPT